MAKMENIGKYESFDYQMITFSYFPMISIACTGGSGYYRKS